MAGSRAVVIAALIANGAIAVMKFVGFLLTGSPSMLSETYHSVSDTGNQVFLLIGLRFSKRKPDRQHPFGYGKAEFFYAFLVSMLLFGIAGWESAKHGFDAITASGHGGGHEAATFTAPVIGGPYPSVWVNYTVLVGAIVFESWAFYKAYQGLSKEIDERNFSGIAEAFRKTSDVTTLTAFTEDFIALSGAAIALVGVYLTEATGMAIFDAAAALIIGLMLMGFAIALAIENKRLILGESLPKDEERALRAVAADAEGVQDVVDFRTVYFGPSNVLVAADVTFRDDVPADRVEELIDRLEAALREANDSVGKVYVEPEDEGDDPTETTSDREAAAGDPGSGTGPADDPAPE